MELTIVPSILLLVSAFAFTSVNAYPAPPSFNYTANETSLQLMLLSVATGRWDHVDTYIVRTTWPKSTSRNVTSKSIYLATQFDLYGLQRSTQYTIEVAACSNGMCNPHKVYANVTTLPPQPERIQARFTNPTTMWTEWSLSGNGEVSQYTINVADQEDYDETCNVDGSIVTGSCHVPDIPGVCYLVTVCSQLNVRRNNKYSLLENCAVNKYQLIKAPSRPSSVQTTATSSNTIDLIITPGRGRVQTYQIDYVPRPAVLRTIRAENDETNFSLNCLNASTAYNIRVTSCVHEDYCSDDTAAQRTTTLTGVTQQCKPGDYNGSGTRGLHITGAVYIVTLATLVMCANIIH